MEYRTASQTNVFVYDGATARVDFFRPEAELSKPAVRFTLPDIATTIIFMSGPKPTTLPILARSMREAVDAIFNYLDMEKVLDDGVGV
jgi:hypothetical protein